MPDPSITRARAVAVLRRIRVFQGLSDAECEDIFALCTSVFLSPGNFLFREGDEEATLYVVLNGEVDISIDGRGTIGTFGAGELLVEMALVRRAPRAATVAARTHTMLISLDPDRLGERLDRENRRQDRPHAAAGAGRAILLRGTPGRFLERRGTGCGTRHGPLFPGGECERGPGRSGVVGIGRQGGLLPLSDSRAAPGFVPLGGFRLRSPLRWSDAPHHREAVSV